LGKKKTEKKNLSILANFKQKLAKNKAKKGELEESLETGMVWEALTKKGRNLGKGGF